MTQNWHDSSIRPATLADADSIAEIYNQGILTGTACFDAFQVSADRYASFFGGDDRKAMFVAVIGDRVVGWCSVSPISQRWAYRFTCVISTFVHQDFRGVGIGRQMKLKQIEIAARIGYHSIVSEILSTNKVSLSMNISLGFRVVGEIAEAGFRDGKWIGLIVMQRILKEEVMKERQIRFAVLTDDIQKSIDLYRDGLGLDMRPICNPIIMFPLGYAELEVCHVSACQELLGIDLGVHATSGVMISLAIDSESHRERALSIGIKSGGTLLASGGHADFKAFRDFNGITWALTVQTPVLTGLAS